MAVLIILVNGLSDSRMDGFIFFYCPAVDPCPVGVVDFNIIPRGGNGIGCGADRVENLYFRALVEKHGFLRTVSRSAGGRGKDGGGCGYYGRVIGKRQSRRTDGEENKYSAENQRYDSTKNPILRSVIDDWNM